MNSGSNEEVPDGSDTPRRELTPARRAIAVIDGHIDSRDLFVGTREIIIAHGEEVYRLRLTAHNKLILTK